MFMLHVLAPLLPSLQRSPLLPRRMACMGFKAEKKSKKKTQKKREKSQGKLTDELKQKKCLSRECFDKILSQQKIRPNHNVVVLYYNLFEMPIWYRIEFLLALRFAVNRQPRNKSDDGNYVRRCRRETI